jgi:hypothetical protein
MPGADIDISVSIVRKDKSFSSPQRYWMKSALKGVKGSELTRRGSGG